MRKVFDLLHWLRKLYWKVFKIKTLGVRVIIKKDGKFLLVKHRYGNYWVFPGGSISRGESYENACKREVKEEVYIKINNFEKTLGTYKNTTGGKNDTVTVLVVKSWEQLKEKLFNIEVKEKRFFEFSDLPKNISPATKNRLSEYLSGRENLSGKW